MSKTGNIISKILVSSSTKTYLYAKIKRTHLCILLLSIWYAIHIQINKFFDSLSGGLVNMYIVREVFTCLQGERGVGVLVNDTSQQN